MTEQPANVPIQILGAPMMIGAIVARYALDLQVFIAFAIAIAGWLMIRWGR